jgi:hypothetical protein
MFIHKIGSYFKKNKIFLIFLIAVMILAFSSDIIFSVVENNNCNSPGNLFEDKYCGKGSILPGSERNFNNWDITLHPLTLLYPALFEAMRLYDDVYIESGSYWPGWLMIEIDTYLKHPNFIEKIIRFILLVLNFCFYGMLAFLFTKLWNNKKWWGKIIPCLFFIIKGIPLVVFIFLRNFA